MEHFTISTLLDIADFLSMQETGTEETSVGIYYHGAVPGSWYNRIQIRSDYFHANGIEKTMDALRKMLPPGEPVLCSVYCPEKQDDLVNYLQEHDIPLVNPQTAMQYDLSCASETHVADIVTLPFERLKEWSACCAAAFPKKDEYSCIQTLADHCTFYGYLQDGAITSTLMLNIVGDWAGLHEVGTRPEFRNQGQATKLVLQSLSDAKKRGCTKAVLQASARGYSLYKSIGFTDCGYLYNFRLSV